MDIKTLAFETENGLVEGVQTKWDGFNILMITGTKGFLACPAIDIEKCNRYGQAAGIVESSPERPIGTLENMAERKIVEINDNARQLGMQVGMKAREAFALIA